MNQGSCGRTCGRTWKDKKVPSGARRCTFLGGFVMQKAI